MVVENPGAPSDLLLIGDHAGRAIPRALGDLGLTSAERERHIAWDIGVAQVGRRLAGRLGATFIHQRYSRLVIDCNRDPARADAIPPQSDGTPIPGNADLGAAAAAVRRAEVFAPYHQAIADELDARQAAGRRTVLVSLHSFTPVMAGFTRPWRYGVLHEGSSGASLEALARLRSVFGEAVGDNQPYAMDGVDYTVPHHAIGRGIDYLELEINQGTLGDAAGQALAADELTPILARIPVR